jgi:hypothetical protein
LLPLTPDRSRILPNPPMSSLLHLPFNLKETRPGDVAIVGNVLPKLHVIRELTTHRLQVHEENQPVYPASRGRGDAASGTMNPQEHEQFVQMLKVCSKFTLPCDVSGPRS